MTKVKICGITNLEDALLSIEYGADQLGFNFYEKSPRYISPGAARQIIDKLGDGITTVGVFVNGLIDTVIRVAVDSKIDVIQLHGSESVQYVADIHSLSRLDVIKAFSVSPDLTKHHIDEFEATAVLLDGYTPGVYGGTGELADWEFARIVATDSKVYLAGGLNPENVGAAIETVRPFAVDVASGVESSPGTKDAEKVKRFIEAVRKSE
ncbi:MAG TPA: phosphoribosylanthranilate isomerase [Pyrinomonadaceae bacterium]|nr:phosphoribosylanthranilate isomerase [Pyrinomonadaceae bacterium]